MATSKDTTQPAAGTHWHVRHSGLDVELHTYATVQDANVMIDDYLTIARELRLRTQEVNHGVWRVYRAGHDDEFCEMYTEECSQSGCPPVISGMEPLVKKRGNG